MIVSVGLLADTPSNVTSRVEALADVLSTMDFQGMVYCQAEFTAPWGVQWEGRAGRAGFFMVIRGVKRA